MSKIITDAGFQSDDWVFDFHSPQQISELLADGPDTAPAAIALDVDGEYDVTELLVWLDQIDLIRIRFDAFSDGRGFSKARQLVALGFAGRLRATGPLIPDQFSALLRAGFTEVEISEGQANRQPEPQWLAQSATIGHSYQQRLRQFA